MTYRLFHQATEIYIFEMKCQHDIHKRDIIRHDNTKYRVIRRELLVHKSGDPTYCNLFVEVEK